MKTVNCLISGVVATLLMCSCTVGPRFVRPQFADMPSSLDTAGVDTLSLARLPWQQVFDDPNLIALIDSALMYNNDLSVAAGRIAEMQSLTRSARAGYCPTVDANIHAQRDQTNDGGHANSVSNEVGARGFFEWELDLWGRVRHENAKATADLMAAREDFNAAQVSLIAAVATAYYNLLSLDNELRIVRQTLEGRGETVRLTRLRFEGGLTSETPYRQAEVEYQRTAASIPVLERDIEVCQNNLALLTGTFPRPISRAAVLLNVNLADTIPAGTPSALLEMRPDVRRAEAQLRAAVAEAGVAYTDRFPRFALTANGGLQSSRLSHFLASPASFLGASVFGPVFDGGRRRAQYHAARHRVAQAESAWRQAVLAAFTDANNAIANWHRMREIYDAAVNLERSAHITLALVRKQYIAGSVTFLDLLDAQRSYFDAQLGLANATAGKQQARITLYRALGGGW